MRPIINFEADGIKFYFDVKYSLTRICDDSGVGKSFLCDALKSALITSKSTGKYPVKDAQTYENINVAIVDGIEDSLESVKKAISNKKSLVIVDEADRLFNMHHELTDLIYKNPSNMYVIVARSVLPNLYFGYRTNADITTEDGLLTVNYYA